MRWYALFFFALTAGTCFAQFPQGLGAADPSQQLKTMGFTMWGHPGQRPIVTSAPMFERPRVSRSTRSKRARKARTPRRRRGVSGY